MSYFQQTYQSKVYRNFKALDATAYHSLVRFYEREEEQIESLDFDEFFDVLVHYVDALFEVGQYGKHLGMADQVIELSIDHNIQQYQGRDVFQHMLFRKAASLYNLYRFEEADYILRELIRMCPEERDYAQFLKKCLRRSHTRLLNLVRAASVFLFLMAAFVISIEVLLVRPFYEMHAELVEMSRNTLFALGCLALLGGYLWHRTRIEQEVERFVQHIRLRKNIS